MLTRSLTQIQVSLAHPQVFVWEKREWAPLHLAATGKDGLELERDLDRIYISLYSNTVLPFLNLGTVVVVG